MAKRKNYQGSRKNSYEGNRLVASFSGSRDQLTEDDLADCTSNWFRIPAGYHLKKSSRKK